MSRLLASALGLALAATIAPATAALAADPTRVPPAAAPGHLLMVDMASAPSISTIQRWQQYSPYKAIAVYIPVATAYDSRLDKVQANLTTQWVAQVRAGGWQVLPIYLGLQAPCSKYSKRISTPNARAQGAAMAADAAASVANLGLPASTPVMYDLEAYPTTDASCRAGVQAMQDSWTRRLHQLGRSSGVYGSVSSTITDIVSASSSVTYAKPDAIWVAKWDGKPDTNLAVLPAGSWPGRRAHQFRGDDKEAYPAGSTPQINVDQNAVQTGVFALPKPDTTAPTLAVAASRATTRSRASLTWKMRDPAGIAQYQVQIKTGKRWKSLPALKRTRQTRYRVTLDPGASACARVRGTDRVANTSGWQTTCITRWGQGKAFKGKTWKRSGNSTVAKRRSLTKGPRVSARTIRVQTRGKVGGQILLGGRVIATFKRAGTHTVTLPTTRSGRLAVRPTRNGKITIVRYLAMR